MKKIVDSLGIASMPAILRMCIIVLIYAFVLLYAYELYCCNDGVSVQFTSYIRPINKIYLIDIPSCVLSFLAFLIMPYMKRLSSVAKAGKLSLLKASVPAVNRKITVKTEIDKTAAAFFLCCMILSAGMNIISFSERCMSYGVSDLATDSSGKLVTKPHACLYWSVVTWTSLGYGDVSPSIDLRATAMLETISAAIYMGVITSYFVKIIE